MKTKMKLLTLCLLMALLLAPTANVYAQSPGGDVIRVGENYILKSGETLNGSLVVIGGNASIEKDAQVTRDIVIIGGNLALDGDVSGNVVVIGGNAEVSTKIGGDMVVIGGQVSLKESAVVKGDLVTIGGQVTQEEGAKVEGNIVNNLPPVNVPDVPSVPDAPNPPNIPNVPTPPSFNVTTNPLWNVMGVIGRALGLAAIAMLLTLFLQPQMDKVSAAIMAQPLLAGSFGLLTVILTPLVIVIMTVTIILIPVALIVAFIVPLAWLFGMIALGQEVGERFTKAINQIWSPVLATGFGTFLLLIVTGSLGLIPCVGWLLSFLVSLLALGGVTMTWFGTRTPAKPAAVQVVEVPPAS
jgi:hypothetical protein